ncbi:MAG TPA: tRNA (adenosine(37)-N6)-threonylcarbamoyltransferase complex dimerization subunit type 1 TsaB [Ignavibacteria bacterium]|nr:tRNA (adenosine(37)-N6)-threonylcarbamoyltransferase complex dimerization subunit type 1 TsaB [Ignavibacteria bacterium]
MKLLLINSSDKNAFAAIVNETEQAVVYASEFNETDIIPGKTPDKLIHCLDKLSTKSDIKDIDAIAVTVGPGSFTGIRVGLALAKGIALGLDKKIIPVSNFDLTLTRLPEILPEKTYCVLLESKLPEYYYAVYKNGQITEKGSETLENLVKILDKDTILVGDFDDETQLKHCYFSVLNVKDSLNEYDSMLKIAGRGFSSGLAAEVKDVKPLYVKEFNFRKP